MQALCLAIQLSVPFDKHSSRYIRTNNAALQAMRPTVLLMKRGKCVACVCVVVRGGAAEGCTIDTKQAQVYTLDQTAP